MSGARTVYNTARTATAARGKTLHHDAVADMGFGNDEIVDLEVMLFSAFAIADFQALLDIDRDPLARELQVGERRRRLPPRISCATD